MKNDYTLGLRYSNEQKFSMDHYLVGNVSKKATTPLKFAPGSWYHVTGVVSKSSGSIKIYVNGILQTKSAFSAETAAYEYGSTAPWRIGVANPSSTLKYF